MASTVTAAEVLEWCRDRAYQLRFIEQMPLNAQHAWRGDLMMRAPEIREQLSARFTLTPLVEATRGSAPSELFLVIGGPDRVRIIASVSDPFGAARDRSG